MATYDVVFTAGHGGRNKFDKGAVGHIIEHDEAVRVMNAVVALLNANGVRSVGYVDKVSTTVNNNLYELVRFHNAQQRAMDIQIHFNATGGDQAGGYGTEVYVNQQHHMKNANEFSKVMADAMGLKNRGGKLYNWYFNANTAKPAYLFEVAFVNSKFDTDQYRKNFDKLVHAIASSIASKFGKTIKGSSNTKPETPQNKPNEGELTMSQYSELKTMINNLENKKIDKTMQEDLVPLFKKAYADGIFKTDHSTKVSEMTYEQALSRLVSYVSRTETKK